MPDTGPPNPLALDRVAIVPKSPLNNGSRIVLAAFATHAAVVCTNIFGFDNLTVVIFLVVTSICGGGAVAAIRGGGTKNRCIGALGLAWVFAVIALFAYPLVNPDRP